MRFQAGNGIDMFIKSSNGNVGFQTTTPTAEVETVGHIVTVLTGKMGTGGSSSTTVTGGTGGDATNFGVQLHIGSAIKLGSDLRTVTAIDSASTPQTLTVDTAVTAATGSTGYYDSGELFAVKTGDSKTLFGVNETGAIQAGNAAADSSDKNSLSIGDSDALDTLTTGTLNYIIGHATDNYKLTTGSRNFFAGYASGEDVTTGEQNTSVGNYALASSAADADRVTAIGHKAGYTANDDCTYVGAYAGEAVTSLSNTAVGSSSMLVDGPESSTAVGRSAHQACTGSHNVAVGYNALPAAGDAGNCVAVGSGALVAATANGNIGIGKNAGNAIVGGSSNICIGGDSDSGNASYTGTINIGGDVVSAQSNSTTIGGTGNLDITGHNTAAGTALGSLARPFGGLMLGARRIYSTRRSCGRVNTTNTGKIDQLAAFGGVSAVLLPAYSIITFCSVTIDDPSGASTHAAMLATSTATGTADDAALTGTIVEVIGSGASGTRSTATTGSATNIALNAAKGQTWYNDTKFHVGAAPVYVYLASAGTSNSGTAGDTLAYITVEYIGAT